MSRKKDWDWGGAPPFGKDKGGAESMLEHIMQNPMMFMRDPMDPRPEHEGQFIAEEDLQEWWRNMQRRYPEIYKADDKLFGNGGAQHVFGTKLMAFFDDDPNRPIRLQVRGSRWVDEGLGHLTPMYIVRYKDSNELSQIELGSGHEEGGWRVGWDDGEGNILPSEGQVFGEEESEEEEVEEEYLQWFQQKDGPIDNAFLIHTSFTADELASLESGNGALSNLASEKRANNLSLDFEARAVIMKIVLAWTHEHAGAVILKNEIGTKFQAIEFNNPIKCSEGIPRIQISYAISPKMDLAEGFLRGEETKVIECSDPAAVAVEQHIISNCIGEELNDIGSGLLLYEGYLVPLSTQRSETPAIPSEGIADGNFGIELELSCAVGTPREEMIELLENVAELPIRSTKSRLKGRSPYRPKFPIDFHKEKDAAVQFPSSKKDSPEARGTRNAVDEWELVNDWSIRASSDLPSSSKFEVVSPILRGEAGLDECRTMMKALSDVSAVQVNKSMGFHVHIDVEGLSLEELIRVCQNFVEYEHVIDSFMPPSRRTGSDESYWYFKSNRAEVLGERGNIEQGCAKLAACKTKDELYNVMNPHGRYYKLNLQNLKKGRQPTIEFRQHSGTSNYQKVAAWVRFCMALVHNSAVSTSLAELKRPTEQTDCFENLFDVLIQDHTLTEFYSKRRKELR